MPKAITYIDLFSGIGGFREGLSRAGGFVCVGHCEIDKYADQSYKQAGNGVTVNVVEAIGKRLAAAHREVNAVD